MRTKGQTSVEFLLLVAFGTLIFVIFFGILQNRILSANLEESSQEIQKLSDIISGEINLAYRFGSGYSRNFWLPTFVGGIKYNASILNNNTLLIKGGGISNLYFFDYNVSGKLKQGNNNIFSVSNKVYINTPLLDVLNIQIDGSKSDWDSVIGWYGISPFLDAKDDIYYENSQPFFPWDLKSAILWNDNDNLYFYIELYNPTINSYKFNDQNNLLILLDTNIASSTGYSNNDFESLITDQHINYIIFDAFGKIDNTEWKNIYVIDYSYGYSTKNPYSFSGTSNNDFTFIPSSVNSNEVKYYFIDDYSMELSVPLSNLGLNVIDEDTIGFVIVSRDNITKAVDYLPGNFDDFSGGIYQLVNN